MPFTVIRKTAGRAGFLYNTKIFGHNFEMTKKLIGDIEKAIRYIIWELMGEC